MDRRGVRHVRRATTAAAPAAARPAPWAAGRPLMPIVRGRLSLGHGPERQSGLQAGLFVSRMSARPAAAAPARSAADRTGPTGTGPGDGSLRSERRYDF